MCYVPLTFIYCCQSKKKNHIALNTSIKLFKFNSWIVDQVSTLEILFIVWLCRQKKTKNKNFYWVLTSSLNIRKHRLVPANTRGWTNVVLMLAHRLRRWTSIKTTLVQRLVFTGVSHDCYRDSKIKGWYCSIRCRNTTGCSWILIVYQIVYKRKRGKSKSLIDTGHERKWSIVGLILGQRRRRWSNIKLTVGKQVVVLCHWFLVFRHFYRRVVRQVRRHDNVLSDKPATPDLTTCLMKKSQKVASCCIQWQQQRQTTVTAYLKSKQLLLFVFARLLIQADGTTKRGSCWCCCCCCFC